MTVENRSSRVLTGGSVTGELFDKIADLPQVEPSGKRALVLRGGGYGSYGHVVFTKTDSTASAHPFWPPGVGDTTEVWVVAEDESMRAPIYRELRHGWRVGHWGTVADSMAKLTRVIADSANATPRNRKPHK